MSGLLHDRLRHQALCASTFRTPSEVVVWMGAVQAQDYPGASWALALRTHGGLTQAAVDEALATGAIVRTHVLRPTWHFVAPADLRWMLALTAPGIRRQLHACDARLELDARLYARASRVFVRALEGGATRTRAELAVALAGAKIAASGQRLAHLVMDAELSGLICSGPRRGAQFTYGLVDERVPPAPALSREDALTTLAARYFHSHGPATAHDFAWWSGLTLGDARKGAALAGVDQLLLAAPPAPDRAAGAHFLLPNYDEYFIAYRHRDAVLDPSRARNVGVFTSAEYPHQIVLHGRVAGSWRRETSTAAAAVTLKPYGDVSTRETRGLHAAARAFGRFLGLPCTVRH